MTEVTCKLGNGQKSYLRYENDTIEINTEKGFLSKTRIPYANFTIQDIDSIKFEKEEKNNISTYKLVMNYHEKEEVVFISGEQLIDLKNEIVEAHEEYIKKIETAKSNYYHIREKNLTNIILNLDFCSTLFKILETSNGHIEWNTIHDHFDQLELIYNDINLMGDSKIYNISLDKLRNLIDNRLLPEIFNEIYELLETLFRTSIQMSENKIDFFNEEYHRLFIVILFRSWDHKLSKITMIEPIDPVALYRDTELLSVELRENIKDNITSSEYWKVINYIYYWIESLENLPFKEDYINKK
jgi:hypothetical protein